MKRLSKGKSSYSVSVTSISIGQLFCFVSVAVAAYDQFKAAGKDKAKLLAAGLELIDAVDRCLSAATQPRRDATCDDPTFQAWRSGHQRLR